MRAAEVVGWTYRGAAYCPEHKPLDGCGDAGCRDRDCCPQPVFACDADWEEHVCDEEHAESYDGGVRPVFERLGDVWDVA